MWEGFNSTYSVREITKLPTYDVVHAYTFNSCIDSFIQHILIDCTMSDTKVK